LEVSDTPRLVCRLDIKLLINVLKWISHLPKRHLQLYDLFSTSLFYDYHRAKM
jgi:hypothetical protein